MVRQGKGGKDWMVPIGARACAWLEKYRDEVRLALAAAPAEQTLFLDDDGQPFDPGKLGDLVKRHLEAAGITQPGACHLFRHACATHMLDNGADIRFVQAMLGHEKLETTAIYTHVAIVKLKAIHEATHPARLHRRAATHAEQATSDDDAQRRALLDALDREAEDER